MWGAFFQSGGKAAQVLHRLKLLRIYQKFLEVNSSIATDLNSRTVQVIDSRTWHRLCTCRLRRLIRGLSDNALLPADEPRELNARSAFDRHEYNMASLLAKLGLAGAKSSNRQSRLRKAETSDVRGGTKLFIHSRLENADEIRLLSIAPQVSGTSEVSIAIEHVRLSREPLYAAVSWMWGAPDDLVEIQANGRRLMIQRNLRRILQQLQCRTQTRKLWIDAICIDQKHLRERNHQVQLMGEIYSRANYVVACLSQTLSVDRKALRAQAEKLRRCLQASPDSTVEIDRYPGIFGNDYFSRRWIIQEISQAQSVIFYCEGVELPKSFLEDDPLSTRIANSAAVAVSRRSMTSTDAVARNRAVQLCRTKQSLSTEPETLEELLYAHETAECKDFHDKVYALLSLTSQAKLHLQIQYEITRQQLMLTVFDVCCIREQLPSRRALSFYLFLQQHLEVSDSDLKQEVERVSVTASRDFQIQGTLRGTIEALPIGPAADTMALHLRDTIPDLVVRNNMTLVVDSSSNADVNTVPSELKIQALGGTSRDATCVKVPGIDQCLFELRENRTAAKKALENPRIAGLASTRPRVGDEIWQFDRTPVAVIARRSDRGVELVGRTFLFPISRSSEPKAEFEQELSWVKDSSTSNHLTPIINLDIAGLYEFASWVNFDA